MTRDVLIRLSGMQQMDHVSPDQIEVITTGDYFLKNGKHYVIYEEVMEGIEGTVHNLVKISPGLLDIRRKGMIETHMVFENDKMNVTRYETPMGEMVIGIHTEKIDLEEDEEHLHVKVDYSLDINYEHVSDCRIVMDICSRENARLVLNP